MLVCLYVYSNFPEDLPVHLFKLYGRKITFFMAIAFIFVDWALSNSSFGVNPEDMSNHLLLVSPKIPIALGSFMLLVWQLFGIRPLVVLSFWAALDIPMIPDKILACPSYSLAESLRTLGTSKAVYTRGTKIYFAHLNNLVWITLSSVEVGIVVMLR